MINISKEQAQQRAETIPGVLRDIFFAPETIDVIEEVAKNNHLSEEKAGLLARVLGWVLLGFVHQDDTHQAVADVLGVDKRIAENIESALKNKIFNRYRDALDHIYTPSIGDAQPRIVDVLSEAPTMPVRSAPTSAAPAPIGALNLAPTKPSEQKEVASPTSLSAKEPGSSETSAPKPFILQEEKTSVPTPTGGDFRLKIDEKLFGAGKTSVTPELQKQADASRRPAQLEIGESQTKQEVPASALPSKEQEPRVVHYTQFKTELNPFGPQEIASTKTPATNAGIAPAGSSDKGVPGEARGLFREKLSTGSMPTNQEIAVPLKPPILPTPPSFPIPSAKVPSAPPPAPKKGKDTVIDLGSLVK